MLACLILPVALAESPAFTPILQVRPRLEASSGKDGDSETGDSLWVSQRSRLGLSLEQDEVTGRVVIQDVRVWGSEANTLGDFSADFVDFHEANLQWRAHEAAVFTVGRQEIAFHEERLVGTVNWTQQGRAWDALRLGGASGELSYDLVGAMVSEGNLVDPDEKDATVWMLRGGYAADGTTADLLVVIEHFGPTELDRQTGGLYLKQKAGGFTGRLEGYYQLGSVGEDANISANMVGVSAAYEISGAGKPSVTLWYDRLSGDDDLGDVDIGAFNTLYATNHKFYGIYDLATFTAGGAVDGMGLQDIAVKLSAKPKDGLTVNADVHVLSFAEDQGGDAPLGKELDVWAGGKLAPGLKLMGGGAVFFPDDGAPGGVDADHDWWAFLQLDASY